MRVHHVFTPEEDAAILDYVANFGVKNGIHHAARELKLDEARVRRRYNRHLSKPVSIDFVAEATKLIDAFNTLKKECDHFEALAAKYKAERDELLQEQAEMAKAFNLARKHLSEGNG